MVKLHEEQSRHFSSKMNLYKCYSSFDPTSDYVDVESIILRKIVYSALKKNIFL